MAVILHRSRREGRSADVLMSVLVLDSLESVTSFLSQLSVLCAHRVLNEEEVEPRVGVTAGQTVKAIVGSGERPADRIRVALASFEAGTLERLHWHPIEAFYFVISGRATVRDLEGNEYDAGPGASIYAPAGIAGAHEWEVRELMRLLSVRGCTDSARKMQFTVEKDTRRSYIDFDELIRREGVSFESHY